MRPQQPRTGICPIGGARGPSPWRSGGPFFAGMYLTTQAWGHGGPGREGNLSSGTNPGSGRTARTSGLFCPRHTVGSDGINPKTSKEETCQNESC